MAAKVDNMDIDEGLYSRQLYVLGHDAMRRMAGWCAVGFSLCISESHLPHTCHTPTRSHRMRLIESPSRRASPLSSPLSPQFPILQGLAPAPPRKSPLHLR